ncbi:MAG: tRNA(Ile)-lysidine synthase [Pyrinomonadaceae bacterium]|nr:tRNA(Ile)-lysidine synthase [Pyrinomonadaceae bacterium]
MSTLIPNMTISRPLNRDPLTRLAKLSTFARTLRAEWRRLELPESEVRVVVAVSGGADSTALLLGLDELVRKQKLQLKLTVAHLDHGLRDDSEADAIWVARLAKELGHDVVGAQANLKTAGENLEQAARKVRYAFLQQVAEKAATALVLTAHTLDDQAETILLRLLRGSAAEGLSGIPASRQLAPGSKVQLVRPLLNWARRHDTENFCRGQAIDFRVDPMNADEAFARVRVRRQLLPLMKSFNNRVVEALGRTAALLTEDAAALSVDARLLLQAATEHGETGSATLNVRVMLQAPAAVRRRALREWIQRERGNLNRVEMIHLLAVEKLLTGTRGGRVAELPGETCVLRSRGRLELSRKKQLKKTTSISKISPVRHRR